MIPGTRKNLSASKRERYCDVASRSSAQPPSPRKENTRSPLSSIPCFGQSRLLTRLLGRLARFRPRKLPDFAWGVRSQLPWLLSTPASLCNMIGRPTSFSPLSNVFWWLQWLCSPAPHHRMPLSKTKCPSFQFCGPGIDVRHRSGVLMWRRVSNVQPPFLFFF